MRLHIFLNFVIAALLAVFIASCTSNDGFTDGKAGIRYKFHIKKEGARKPVEGDILVLRMTYRTQKDSLLFDSREVSGPFRMKMQKNLESGSIYDAFAMIGIGDSATFKIDAAQFFTQAKHTDVPLYIKPGDKLIFDISLVEILTVNQLEAERNKLLSQDEKEEKALLADYLKIANITTGPTDQGIYFVERKKGKGKTPEVGKPVVINYTGSFIDGRVFTTTYDKEPLKFIFGVGQVIDGLDFGLATMQVGGSATLIIPSRLAYSDKGFQHLIPPYTTLVFEVELLEVKE